MDVEFGRPIGLNPAFSAHIVGEREILLLSEERSFRLTGKLYVALLPHLDGKKTGDEIAKAFEGRVPDAQLRSVLSNMLTRNYIRYLDATAPTGRQALWVDFGLVPADAERELAGHAVAIAPASKDPAVLQVAKALRLALAQAGVRVVPRKDADLTIVPVEDYLRRDLAALNRRMRRAGRSWLPVKAGGRTPLFGPLFRPTGASCWACLGKHMLENRPGDALVDTAVAAVRPARSQTPATLGLAANFVALEIARALAQPGTPALESHIVSFDLSSRAYAEHFVRPDPACPICGKREKPSDILERAKAPLAIQPREILPHVDGGWRSLTAEEVVRRLDRYVSPITGIISGLEDRSIGNGLHVFQARQTNPQNTNPRENRLIGRPGASAGKGISETQAKASCLAEAMERYLCGFTGREPRMRARWEKVKDRAPHPYTYLNYSERQYDGRDDWNKNQNGFNWIGERFDESREIEWTPAWSLSRNELRWLPSRYCYFAYADSDLPKDSEGNLFCRSDSNGCASGNTVEEAVIQGFLELVERDACALWWYNRVRRPEFDLDALADPFANRMRAHLRTLGRSLSVLDLTNDLGIPAAIAVSHTLSDGKSIVMGLGAHLDAGVAVNRALAEMNQMLSIEMSVKPPSEATPGKDDDNDMVNWLKNHSVETDPYCLPDGLITVDSYARPQIQDLKAAVDHCVRVVSDRGFDMIVLDQSRPEVDFAAARVVVPGMRHFWARLRGGRLYQAPVDMGWLAQPRDEADLNPVPFFL